MSNTIAILLHGTIKNDYRVIKTVKSLATQFQVDVFYIGDKVDLQINNVRFYPTIYPKTLKHKLLRHTFFCKEYSFLFDVVVASNTTYKYIWANDLPTLLPALKLKDHFQAKLIYDSHEIFNETLNQFFPRKTSFLKKMIFSTLLKVMKNHGEATEKQLVKNVDLFITVNQSILDYFVTKYSIENSLVLMNFPYSNNELNYREIDFRKMYNWELSDSIFLYQGVLNQGRGLELMIHSMSLTPDNFKLIIIGSGPLEKDLKQLVTSLQLEDKVKFIPKVKLEDLPNYTVAADFGINLLENLNLSKQMASPNKLFEYIHAEIPVICSNTLENNRVLDQFKIGLTTENSKEDIAQKMSYLSENNKFSSEEFKIAKSEFSWEKQEHTLLQSLISLK